MNKPSCQSVFSQVEVRPKGGTEGCWASQVVFGFLGYFKGFKTGIQPLKKRFIMVYPKKEWWDVNPVVNP